MSTIVTANQRDPKSCSHRRELYVHFTVRPHFTLYALLLSEYDNAITAPLVHLDLGIRFQFSFGFSVLDI